MHKNLDSKHAINEISQTRIRMHCTSRYRRFICHWWLEGHQLTNTVEKIYVGGNTETETWVYTDTLDTAVRLHRAVISYENILIVGGFGSSQPLGIIQIIDSINGETSSGGLLDYKVFNAAVINVNNVIYAFGGKGELGYLLDTWQYYIIPPPASNYTPEPTNNSICPTNNPTSISIIPIINDTSNTVIESSDHSKRRNSTTWIVPTIIAFILAFVVIIFIISIIYQKRKQNFKENTCTLIKEQNIQLMDLNDMDKPKTIFITDDCAEIRNKLLKEMRNYHQTMDITHIRHILDDYHLLLQQYNQNEKQVELILNELDECNAAECIVLKRNYRNRSDFRSTDSDACSQIIDKIHSFCFHCSHVKRRKTTNEKIIEKNQNKKSKQSTKMLDVVQDRMEKYSQLFGNAETFVFGWEFNYIETNSEEKHNIHNNCINITQK
eukprot:535364_1